MSGGQRKEGRGKGTQRKEGARNPEEGREKGKGKRQPEKGTHTYKRRKGGQKGKEDRRKATFPVTVDHGIWICSRDLCFLNSYLFYNNLNLNLPKSIVFG